MEALFVGLATGLVLCEGEAAEAGDSIPEPSVSSATSSLLGDKECASLLRLDSMDSFSLSPTDIPDSV